MQGQHSDTKDKKLFIGGLNHDTVEGTLREYFEQWGEVTDCVIMKDSVGRSRGFGFITYKESYQLQNSQRNKVYVIDGKEVDAKLAVPKDFEQVDTNREQHRKLFIGGLNYETTVEGLQRYFGQYGEVVDCNVMKDGDGRSRGFGFVTYGDISHVDEAQRKRPHTIDGKEVETKRAMPKDSGENNMTVKKMFVGGLKEDTTEDMIRQVFLEYGPIEDVDILKDKSSGRPRGFCFVVFSDYDSVDRAVLKKRHDLNGFNVEVRKAVGKDQMNSRGPGPRGFGGARDRWMDGPPRNFSHGGGRFDRGGGDGFGNNRGRGRGGYNNNDFGGPSGGGRGGYNNYGRGGNFGDSGGSGFGGNYGGPGGDGNFGGPGGGGNYGGSGGGNFGGPGGGGNYGGSGGGNFGGPGGGGNYGGSGGGNFGGSGGGNFGGSGGGNFGGSGGGNYSGSGGGNYGGSGGGNYGGSGSGNYGDSGGGNFGGSGGGNFGGSGNDAGGSGGGSKYSGSGRGGNSGGAGGNYGGSGGGGFDSGIGSNFNSYGGASGGGNTGGYQQQNWSGQGGYGDTSNNWGGNSGSGGFGNSYNSDYSGGPVKAASGYTARSQGPYGGGFGSGGNRGNSSGGAASGW